MTDKPDIPRVPKNYIYTEYGFMPNPDISDGVRELYSNYFMVKETIFSNMNFYAFENGNISIYTKESRDYEDPNNFEELQTETQIILRLPDFDDFDRFTRKLEKFSIEKNHRLNLDYSKVDKKSKLYEIDRNLSAGVRLINTISRTSPMNFNFDDYNELEFSISRQSNEHILDNMDICFTEMGKYSGFLSDFGVVWNEVANQFYSMDYEDFFFHYVFEEVPRDFWESPNCTLSRMNKEDLEDVIDSLLGLHKEHKTSFPERAKEIEEQLDYVNRLRFLRIKQSKRE